MPMPRVAFLISALLATCLSQAEPLPDVYLDAYGGTYSMDCGDPNADHVQVHVDRLVFSGQGEEWVGTDILPSLSYWGRNPPPGFEIALLGGEGPESVLLQIYADEAGKYILLEGYVELLAENGEEHAEEPKFYRCAPDD